MALSEDFLSPSNTNLEACFVHIPYIRWIKAVLIAQLKQLLKPSLYLVHIV